MALKLEYKSRGQALALAFIRNKDPIARAVTLAFRDAAAQIERDGRASIAAAKFPRSWQLGFRVAATPRAGFSLKPALRGRHRFGGLPNVFEHGATIRTRKASLLWIPLPAAPKRINGRRATPKLLGPLFKITRAGKAPLLAGYVGRAPTGRVSTTLAQLRTGARNRRRQQSAAAFGGRVRASFVALPLFVGVPTVHIQKRFNIAPLYDQARGKIVSFYAKHMNEVSA